MPNTVHLHCVLATTPEKLFRAFTQPEALTRWLPPYGFVAKIWDFDPTEGGGYGMSFSNFTTGKGHAFRCVFREIVPNRRLVYSDRFDDVNLPGDMLVTVTIAAVSVGSDLRIVQEGIPDVIPLEACYLGWQQSLDQLARLVEPHIPD